jgi:ABC-type sugar transport system substrate-binding protein
VLISALSSGFVDRVEENPAVPQAARDRIERAAEKGIPVVPVDQVEQVATDEGLTQEQAQAVADDYGDAQLQGLKRAIGAVGAFAFLSLWFTRGLPGRVRAG